MTHSWHRFALVLSLCSGLMRAKGDEWPQFLGPQRNGATSGTNLAATWPKEGPPALWQHPVGQGFAGPVVSGGKLIAFHRLGDREIVTALDAKTGKGLWKAEYPTGYRDDFGFEEGPRATPSISGDLVFTWTDEKGAVTVEKRSLTVTA